MAMHPACIQASLLFLFLGSISYTVMAAFVPSSPGHWQDVADASTSLEFNKEAQFAVGNVTGLVFVRVLEGQIWAPQPIGEETRRFLIEARNVTSFYYKVYEGVVTHIMDGNGTNILQSFEAVFG